MKKQLFIVLTLLLSLVAVNVSAQSFLKKIKKTVEKEVVTQVKEELNKLKGQQTKSQSQEQTTQTQEQQSQNQTSQNQDQRKYSRTHEVKTIDPIVDYGPIKGNLNGHEWVDLGLPSGTRWATCNVGATTPSQPGSHYAWGETTTKSAYTEGNSKLNGKDVADFSGDKTKDVATLKWGKGWRMPTQEEFRELMFYCYWKYVQVNGRWGSQLTCNTNNNSIFLPATGLKDGTKLMEPSGCGWYWTSTPRPSVKNNGAHDYHFGGALGEVSTSERYYGQAIRPVADYDVNTEIPSSGEINGHKWVDLGLPSGLKWATCNVGTDAVDQDGKHYAWGEIKPYIEKGTKNELSGKKMGDIAGNVRYDVARALWGGTWRLPTEDDFKELMDNCTFEWTNLGRRSGLKVTSNKNGNYIFLPASGVFSNSYDAYGRAGDINGGACYWTSTPARNDYSYDAYAFNLSKRGYFILYYDRYCGYSIRPVSE